MARKWGAGRLQRMADQGRRELGEAAVAFPGQTPVVQSEMAGLYDGQERLEGRIQELEEREQQQGKGLEMDRD